MVKAGGAWCCEETNLKPEALANVISRVLTDENIYNTATIAAEIVVSQTPLDVLLI